MMRARRGREKQKSQRETLAQRTPMAVLQPASADSFEQFESGQETGE
jgi:hypothetical protein